LSALAEAEQKRAHIIVIAAGGQLAQIAKDKSYPLFEIPSGIQPRMSSFYFLAAFVELLEPLGLVEQGKMAELQDAAGWLEQEPTAWAADVAAKDNLAKQIAQELM